MRHFDVQMTMHSDWRVGTGAGRRGQVDQLVARDTDGLPHVPGSTFAGLWRNWCEVAAQSLDGPNGSGWQEWAEYLFGSQPHLTQPLDIDAHTHPPRPALIRASPLRLHGDVRGALRSKPALIEATTFVRYRNSMDSEIGATAEHHLFAEELARSGLTLHGSVTLNSFSQLDADQQRAAMALLGVGAMLLQRVGAGRRRGAGQCDVQINGLAPDLDWLEQTSQPPPVPSLTRPARRALPARLERPARWDKINLCLRACQPLIVGERVVGNEIRSADYLPGSMLLPALLAAIGVEAAHDAARSGQLVVTNAIVTIDGSGGRPAPDCFHRHKSQPDWWVNLATEALPEGMVPYPLEGYIGRPADDELPRWVTSSWVETLHNTIDDSTQAVVADSIRTYRAIPAGTEFAAEIRVAEGLLPYRWEERLNTMLRIGRARRFDYGEVAVTAVNAPAADPFRDGNGRLSVWLQSDLLLHSLRLGSTVALTDIARLLEHELQVALRPISARSVAAIRRVESWHSASNLPRSTLLGASAGTCLFFEIADGPINPDLATYVQTAGIGQRRGEGFGQVTLNDPLLDAAMSCRRPSATPTLRVFGTRHITSQAELTGQAKLTVLAIERAAWSIAIDAAAATLATSEQGLRQALGDQISSVTATQMNILRLLISTSYRIHAERWLSAAHARPAQWPASVVTRLHSLITEPQAIWDLLALNEESLCTTGSAGEHKAALKDYALQQVLGRCLTVHRRHTWQTGDSSK